MLSGEKVLVLKNTQEQVSMPHLNIKGTIKNVNENILVIELSDYSKTYLETTEIDIYNDDMNLEMNQKIFIKFNDIHIEGKSLSYSSIEIYKHVNEIKVDNEKEDFFICKNDYGGFMKVKGTSFRYNNNIFFKSDYDLSENNEVYFVNIKNGNLLIEEIKSLIFPFKIYNMINPQETNFNEIVEIYINR